MSDSGRAAPSPPPEPPLVWIDMEMSGLDPDSCRILEIASIVTDGELAILAEGPDLVVHQDEATLSGMDEWNRNHHAESGLADAVRRSRVTEAEAERATLEFLRRWTQPGASPLCGNSVWQDRRFLARHMPEIDRHLHYRMVDVSTVKELCRRWYPGEPPMEKKQAHRALEDIRESIEELRRYRQRIFRAP